MAIRKASFTLYSFSWLLLRRPWRRHSRIKNRMVRRSMMSNLTSKRRNNNKKRKISSKNLLTTKHRCRIWFESLMMLNTLIGKTKDNATLFKESAISLIPSNSSKRMSMKMNNSIITSTKATIRRRLRMFSHSRVKRVK